ncbi:stalk domain-containing protein [Paenibacillus chitinolyticus]|uniref:stalk domain-containing protein n=1 Tax=Paenibacillus chitinolyticus TaxID=79263 RepID=UPI00366D81F8
MKKYVIGFAVGAIVSASTVAYAGNTIQAVLFPAKYQVNGESKTLPADYKTLNVDGHAYVPIRFAAESLGAVVAYEGKTNTISIDNGFNVTTMDSTIRAGHLKVSDAASSTVEGQLYIGQDHWDRMAQARNSIEPGSEVDAKGTILFFDAQGKPLGQAPLETKFTAEGDQIKSFKAVADHNVSGYAFASLQAGPVPHPLPVPPNLSISDETGTLGIGTLKLIKQNDFTKVSGWVSVKKPGTLRFDATLQFYDAEGRELGTATVKGTSVGSTGESLSATTFETAGKGDLTGYKSVKVKLNSADPVQ